ncbi:MAG: hypothetical protein R2862_11785 [Thermoanaerobaculia bacterium]
MSQREDGELVGGEPEETAWKLDWEHTAEKLPFGLRGVIDIEHYSDFELFRDFERGESQNTRRFIYSNAFLSGNWGVQSATLLLDQRETFLGDGQETVTQRQLPRARLPAARAQAGRPAALPLGFQQRQLPASRARRLLRRGLRAVRPPAGAQAAAAPGHLASMALTAGGRATWWGDTFSTREVDPVTGVAEQRCGDRAAEDGEIYCGETLTRVYPTATFEMVGPSFSKIFDHGGETFAKFKHVIEPRVTYGYLGDFEEQDRVPQFDEIDILRPSNLVEVSLINRLLAKPSDETRGGRSRSSPRARAGLLSRRPAAAAEVARRADDLVGELDLRQAPLQSVEGVLAAGAGCLQHALLGARLDLDLRQRQAPARRSRAHLVHALRRRAQRNDLRPGAPLLRPRHRAAAAAPRRPDQLRHRDGGDPAAALLPQLHIAVLERTGRGARIHALADRRARLPDRHHLQERRHLPRHHRRPLGRPDAPPAMRYLVLGGSGIVGRAVAAEAARRGADVKARSREETDITSREAVALGPSPGAGRTWS